jgi:hypothetical protein
MNKANNKLVNKFDKVDLHIVLMMIMKQQKLIKDAVWAFY